MEEMEEVAHIAQLGTSLQPEETLSLLKSAISSEFSKLRSEFLHNAEKQSKSLKRKLTSDCVSFKFTGNKKQYEFNLSILDEFEALKDALDDKKIRQANSRAMQKKKQKLQREGSCQCTN